MENEIVSATLSAAEVVEAAPTALDNALTLGIVAAMAIAVIILVIRKLAAQNQPAPVAEQSAEEESVVAEAPTAPGTAGEVKLNNVEPTTAAMLMAIVADKMQKPINELRFISIKEVE